jgi:maltose alpha-D-glucosyltransferase/alpha-amylase
MDEADQSAADSRPAFQEARTTEVCMTDWRPISDLWYKSGVIYCIDVETFQDSDGDGIGDFQGLTARLDYLQRLGVTCLWLLPFYPTPNRDNGYDVLDYYGVDARLGTLGDFVEFARQAKARGMHLLVDLVVNHTSDQHPWFQAARGDPRSRFRDFYLWAEERPKDHEEGVVFPGVQQSTWSYDRRAGAYYHHRFYKHQPDLNIGNPAVREEICKVMGFWLALGVDGFRVDAAPFLIELPKAGEDDLQYHYLEEMRRFLSWRRGDAILLAEANVDMDMIPRYFGQDDRMHMVFNFYGNQHLFLALARGRAEPLARGLRELPPLPTTGQWAEFLRNHDELSLDRLSEAERQEVFRAFGPEERMQLYGRGIRRRLAPILQGDQRCLRLAFSLLLTLPGTPVIWYGDEIGMGDDLSLDERTSVRTPMQWADEQNAGFSDAPPKQLVRPVVSDGGFGYKRVNVAAQRRDPGSLLRWVEHAVRVRAECPEIGWGAWQVLDTGAPSVIAIRYEWEGRSVIAVHNLAREACTATIDLDEGGERRLVDLLDEAGGQEARGRRRRLELEGYGFRWLRVGE